MIRLYCEPDGNFPNHLPDPTVLKYVRDLIQKVKDEGADVGIGYDGDSDRVGIVDNLGQMIYADRLLALVSRELLENHPGETIIFDVKCSQALPEDIEKHGGKPMMWKTGHSLLKAKMKETGALLAGEMSGHMFFADDFYGYDDAIYASGRLLQYLSKQDKPLSDVADTLTHYYSTPEVRIDVESDEAKFKVMDEVKAHFQEHYETIDVDGVRVLFGDGWGLIRVSNTQPVLVTRCEAKTQERLEEIVEIIAGKLKEYPSVKLDEDAFK